MMIYLDNNATTRLDPRVLDAMLPYLTDQFGNPSSLHHFGSSVAAAIEEARSAVARLIAARDSEIIFTSGGTESNNTALHGVLAARPNKRHVVISAVEHHAILEPADALARSGVDVTRIGVDRQGRPDLAALEAAIRPDTALVSFMLANNETGAIFPLREISRIARSRGALVHTDAVNAVGKMRVNVDELGVDLLSLSAHKLHGPKGVGALYVRRTAPWRPFILGGPQERQRRGGTLNAAGIIGLGRACELMQAEQESHWPRIAALRDRLQRELTSRFHAVHVMAGESPLVPNTLCVCFDGVSAEALVMLLSENSICVSSGAACASGSLEPSHVLQAMGIEPHIAQGQVRFSLSHETTDEEIDHALNVLPALLQKVAALG
ncbi:Cysteine desulfurase [Phycisphaerae bacterium RAS1]|nr:Cysteine desulfurase [Phycisphaerae bacterium RAS1]